MLCFNSMNTSNFVNLNLISNLYMYNYFKLSKLISNANLQSLYLIINQFFVLFLN